MASVVTEKLTLSLDISVWRKEREQTDLSLLNWEARRKYPRNWETRQGSSRGYQERENTRCLVSEKIAEWNEEINGDNYCLHRTNRVLVCGRLCFRVWLTVGGAEDSEDFKVQRHKSCNKGKKKTTVTLIVIWKTHCKENQMEQGSKLDFSAGHTPIEESPASAEGKT